MNHISLMLLSLLVLTSGCIREPLVDTDPKPIPEIGFWFESGAPLPDYVLVHQRADGKLIDYFQPKVDETLSMNIPEAYQAPQYQLSFVKEVNHPHLDKQVEVITFEGFGQDFLGRVSPGVLGSAKKELSFRASVPFCVLPHGDIVVEMDTSGKEARLTLDLDKPYFLLCKLEGETAYRYLELPKVDEYPNVEVAVDNLPRIEHTKTLEWNPSMTDLRVYFFLQYEGQDTRFRAFDFRTLPGDPYEAIRYPDFPAHLKRYTAYVHGHLGGEVKGQAYIQGFPEEIVLPQADVTISDANSESFGADSKHTDFAGYTFEGATFMWHLVRSEKDPQPWMRPEMPQEILNIYPGLTAEASLINSTLFQFTEGNQSLFEQVAFGERKAFFIFDDVRMYLVSHQNALPSFFYHARAVTP